MNELYIARYYMLLVAVLAAGTTHAAADVYVTKLDDEQLHSPVSETLHVIDECECHMRCQQRSGCTGGSYDPVADVCRLTDGDATTVTTRPLAGSSAFFKFSFSPASMVIFLSQTPTNNGALENLRAICAEEGGWPLIIKTSTVRNQAVELLKSYVFWQTAWLSAFEVNVAGQPVYVWPDGTRVTDKAFSASDFRGRFGNPGPKSLLKPHNFIEQVAENLLLSYPVLCFKNV